MKKELEARTKRFALSIIQLVGKLPRSKTSDVTGYQVLKSGTSIGANYREANRAESHDDFIHKLALCEKEAAETEYWLELALEAKLIERIADCGSRNLLPAATSRGLRNLAPTFCRRPYATI
jgi:four helix bundle protein